MGSLGYSKVISTDPAQERVAQKSYWADHSADASVEAMMLDSQAAMIDKEERPEVRSFTYSFHSDKQRRDCGRRWTTLINIRMLSGLGRLPLRCTQSRQGLAGPCFQRLSCAFVCIIIGERSISMKYSKDKSLLQGHQLALQKRAEKLLWRFFLFLAD